jgi:hypothetical protein
MRFSAGRLRLQGRSSNMKSSSLRAAGLLVAMAAAGGSVEMQRVDVYLQNSQIASTVVREQAQMAAARIYSQIGITIEWHLGAQPPRDAAAITMQFDVDTPHAYRPGALGYAAPFQKSGTRIHVFFDRVAQAETLSAAGVLLGHVMAHELGHVLERCECHTQSGLMMAHWGNRELTQMQFHPMSFTPEGADMIRAGLSRAEAAR